MGGQLRGWAESLWAAAAVLTGLPLCVDHDGMYVY
jgi:hypothetical protein